MFVVYMENDEIAATPTASRALPAILRSGKPRDRIQRPEVLLGAGQRSYAGLPSCRRCPGSHQHRRGGGGDVRSDEEFDWRWSHPGSLLIPLPETG